MVWFDGCLLGFSVGWLCCQQDNAKMKYVGDWCLWVFGAALSHLRGLLGHSTIVIMKLVIMNLSYCWRLRCDNCAFWTYELNSYSRWSPAVGKYYKNLNFWGQQLFLDDSIYLCDSVWNASTSASLLPQHQSPTQGLKLLLGLLFNLSTFSQTVKMIRLQWCLSLPSLPVVPMDTTEHCSRHPSVYITSCRVKYSTM